MKRNWTSKIGVILVILMALSLLLSWRPVAEKVSGFIGTTTDNLVYYAKTAFIAALGLWLISSGIAALTVPVVGVILIVIGVVLVGYALWPLFNTADKPESK